MIEIPMEVAASLAEIPVKATVNTARRKSGTFTVQSNNKLTVTIRNIGFKPRTIFAVYIGAISSISANTGISFILSSGRRSMEYLRYNSSATAKINGLVTSGIFEHPQTFTKDSITIESGNSSVYFKGGSWYYLAIE